MRTRISRETFERACEEAKNRARKREIAREIIDEVVGCDGTGCDDEVFSRVVIYGSFATMVAKLFLNKHLRQPTMPDFIVTTTPLH